MALKPCSQDVCLGFINYPSIHVHYLYMLVLTRISQYDNFTPITHIYVKNLIKDFVTVNSPTAKSIVT